MRFVDNVSKMIHVYVAFLFVIYKLVVLVGLDWFFPVLRHLAQCNVKGLWNNAFACFKTAWVNISMFQSFFSFGHLAYEEIGQLSNILFSAWYLICLSTIFSISWLTSLFFNVCKLIAEKCFIFNKGIIENCLP